MELAIYDASDRSQSCTGKTVITQREATQHKDGICRREGWVKGQRRLEGGNVRQVLDGLDCSSKVNTW